MAHHLRTRKAAAAGGAVAVALTALAGCSAGGSTADPDCTPAHEFDTLTDGTLTIASYDYPPATLVESDTVVSGFEGDLLLMFAEQECLSVSVSSAGGASAVIPSIQSGRADVGSGGWYRTEARAEIVRLSEPTALDVPAVISLSGITSDELTDGYRVASVAGDLQNDSLSALLGDDFSTYPDATGIFGDLAAGRIDAIVQSTMAATGYLDASPIEGVQIIAAEPVDGVPEFDRPGQLNYPLPKDNTELGDALDESIVAWRADGTIADLLEQYGLDPALADIDEVYNL